MKKLVLLDANAVRRAIRHASKRSPEDHLLHQMHCVLLTTLGNSCYVIARWFGDSPRTIQRWVGEFNKPGNKDWSKRGASGRRSRLNDDVARRVAAELALSPCLCGYSDTHWSGRLLAQHLLSCYGIELGLRQCQRTIRHASPPMTVTAIDNASAL